MEYLVDPVLIKFLILSFSLGTGLGAFFLYPRDWFSKKSKSPKLENDKIKLENEVLKDKVKQLDSKIKTLEKAMQILEKN